MGILFGSDATSVISELTSTLRERTRALAAELDGREYDRYTPWMCLRPVLDSPLDINIASMPYTPGELIADADRLNLIDTFLKTSGSSIVANAPVDYNEWPVLTDIAQRPDVVASFKEGRALLSASSFLDENYTSLVDFVVPQKRQKASGFDSHLARGAVFRTFPTGNTGLLAGFQLAHAMGHQAAMLLNAVDPIFASGRFDLIHYEVRDDHRTAQHAFVSAVAMAYMVVLSHAIYGSDAIPFIADDHVSGYGESLPLALQAGLRSIDQSDSTLTELGSSVFDECNSLAYG
jgi:hypothetical protein